jgi:preprotein translocase subunit SecA
MSVVNKILKGFFGSKADRDLKVLWPIVDQVNVFEDSVASLDNDGLRAKTEEFKDRIREARKEKDDEISDLQLKAESGEVDIDEVELLYAEIDKLKEEAREKEQEVLDEIMPEAFALVRETARRFKENEEVVATASDMDRRLSPTREHMEIRDDQVVYMNSWMAAGNKIQWDMVHYDVQLIGGAVLHQGKIAEMATGEGKTLVATLPVYLNALTGRGVHVVTVNDYLAKRDSEWMAPIFEFHGLSIDCIDKHRPNSEERRKAYRADVIYGTNNEFGFDYLRDNMARSVNDLVQRDHVYAIVDEVDSVLVDDARTPLIISGPIPQGKDQKEYLELKPKVERLFQNQRKLVTQVLSDAKKKIKEGDSKEGGLLLFRAFRGLPKNNALIKFLSEEGMKTLLQKTENFYMQDQSKEMYIVDDELFFTIDEKTNGIELTDKGIELISGDTDAEFFVMPDISLELSSLENMEATDKEKAQKKDEILRNYSVKSERIHTLNQLLKAYTLFERDVEYVIMDGKVKIVDEQTGRIMEGRRYSDGLHQAIEAKENVKIEDATQTFATITLQNYFRMYEKLSGMTGTAETEAGELWDIYKLDVVVIPTNRPIARDDRNDLVYKTKREKYNAVVEEIVNLREAGRPVLVGTTNVEVSELLSRMLQIRHIPHQVLNAKLHQKEADIVAEAGKPGTVTIATNMAGRGTDIKLTPEVKEAGGLAIIGTERHDSRRVDRQLRGRAGRQGDPGSSQFYVSLEDNLMRLFGSERIAKLMDRMGLEEGEVIQHSMINKSIERAQKKVEENNFGIRKRLLEYDDVMNAQREVVYTRRRHALYGERLSVDIANMMYDTVESLVGQYQPLKDYEGFRLDMIRVFTTELKMDREEFTGGNPSEIVTKVYHEVVDNYKEKAKRTAEVAFPVIRRVYEDQGGQFENIVVPFTDGSKALQVVINLEEAYNSEARKLIDGFEKSITLAMIDESWKEHLREMDDLKQSVQGARYEQKDPLLIYKLESFNLFQEMLNKVNQEIVSFLFKGELPTQDPNQLRQARAPQTKREPKMTESREEVGVPGSPAAAVPPRQVGSGPVPTGPQGPRNTTPVTVDAKYGRNDKVKIQNINSGETKEVKYKVAKPLIDNNEWAIID